MGRWLTKVRTNGVENPTPHTHTHLTRKRGNAVMSDPWAGLLTAAGPLRDTLEAFRVDGCALNVVGGRVFFGPYDDFEGCAWRDADEWHAAYAIALAPHELTLRDLLARLLEQLEDAA